MLDYRVDKWLADEGVSGTIDWTKREINVAIEEADEGDTIIVAELSRLGRSLKTDFRNCLSYVKRKK